MTNAGELLGYAKEMRRVMTPSERVLWAELRNRQVMNTKFRRQHPFGQFILDFYAADVKLAIEVDGSVHNTPDQQAYDRWRDDILRAQGLTVLRFTNSEIDQHLVTALDRISTTIHHLRQQMAPLPSGEGLG